MENASKNVKSKNLLSQIVFDITKTRDESELVES